MQKNRNKSAILNFFSAIIELLEELLISNMHNRFGNDTWKTFHTRSNYWRKMRKIAINQPFLIFFRPLLNLSENWSLVTCITNLGRIHEKLFKLSLPQENVLTPTLPNFNCNSPPFLIKIKRRAKNVWTGEGAKIKIYLIYLFFVSC